MFLLVKPQVADDLESVNLDGEEEVVVEQMMESLRQALEEHRHVMKPSPQNCRPVNSGSKNYGWLAATVL